MKEKKRAHVVTHTHWDREWYLPFEFFRARLVKLMEELFQIMEKDLHYRFHLDGQTIVLEDYQEVGGDMKRLTELIRAERIQVGPWYILPDEFLITGEAWIRNYLYSKRLAKRFDIPLSKVAYLPDMFGHNAYMPTILKGLGMKWAVLWRGVGEETISTFVWKSPHGDAVNVYHLVDGYDNAAHQGKKEEELREKLVEEARRLKKLQSDSAILLMNGTDHELPLPRMNQLLKEISGEEFEFSQSDLEKFVEELGEPKVELIGELRNPKKEPVLKDVTSTRVSGKKLHFEAEQLYEHYVEPLLALAKLRGKEIPLEELWYGWRLILQSQPHDSICGCGTDEVHKAVLNRLRRAIDHGKMLCAKIMVTLAGPSRSDFGLLVFNPLEWEREEVFETTVYLPKGAWAVEGAEFSYVEPLERDVSCPQQILAHKFLSEPSTDNVVSQAAQPHRCVFVAKLPMLGFRSFKIVPKKYPQSETDFDPIFRLNKNGTLRVDWSGSSYNNLCYFKDVEDAGDEYNYSPVCKEAYTSLSIDADVENVLSTPWIKRNKVKFMLKLPKSLAPNRKGRSSEFVEMPVIVEYSFYRNKPQVNIKVELENNAKDHRLTVVFPIGKIKELYTDGYFGLVKHEVKDYKGNHTNWAELPENTFALWSLVTVPDKKITLVTKGMHEVHVTEDGLELTLLRGVEWLSRDDLKTRKKHAGPEIRTPGAQEKGKHEFRFSLILHGEWSIEKVYKAAKEASLEPMIWQGEYRITEVELPFNVKRGLLSALKPADNEEGVVVRVFDPEGGEPEVNFKRDVKKTDLAEQVLKECIATKGVKTWIMRI